jgi:hypothetical protein
VIEVVTGFKSGLSGTSTKYFYIYINSDVPKWANKQNKETPGDAC